MAKLDAENSNLHFIINQVHVCSSGKVQCTVERGFSWKLSEIATRCMYFKLDWLTAKDKVCIYHVYRHVQDNIWPY